MLFFLLLLVLILGIFIGLWLARSHRHEPPSPPPPTPWPPPPPCPDYKVPDTFTEASLPATIVTRIVGTPANGAALTAPIGNQVIWVDAGDEVLVHLDSLQTKILDRMVVMSIDLECDQVGRTPMIVTFALGDANDPAGLVAVTDEYPRGDGRLAARWGDAIQAALWSALLGLSGDHATERSQSPSGISAKAGVLTLHAGARITAAEVQA